MFHHLRSQSQNGITTQVETRDEDNPSIRRECIEGGDDMWYRKRSAISETTCDIGDETLPLLCKSCPKAILTISHGVHYKRTLLGWKLLPTSYPSFTRICEIHHPTRLHGRPRKHAIYGSGAAIVSHVLCMPLRLCRSLKTSFCKASSALLIADRWAFHKILGIHSLRLTATQLEEVRLRACMHQQSALTCA